MPEITLGGVKEASDTIGAKAVAPNTVVIESEDDDVAVAEEHNKKDEGVKEQEKQATTKDSDTDEEDKGSNDKKAETKEGFKVCGVDMSEYAREFEETGELSGETYNALEKAGFPRELVDAYIRGVKQGASEQSELAQKHVDSIMAEVGGEDHYNRVMAWAVENLTQDEQDAYDNAVTSSDPAIARFVVQGLMSRYEREYGREPSLVSGNRVPDVPVGYKDRSSMIKAMSDARYGNDPEYTREVERKVLASGLMRTYRN